MNKRKILKRIACFSFTKIIIGILILGIVIGGGQFLIQNLLDFVPVSSDLNKLISGIVVALLALLFYSCLFRFYEKRKITELSKTGFIKNITIGLVLGSVLQSLTILVIYLKGGYTVVTINPVQFLIPPLTMGLTSAVFEEILLRGIIFRITEEQLGSYLALLISALLFGLMHLANPNSSLTVGIGLAIQAGLLLGAAYMYARSLWLPIAIHFSWNFTQSAIFGASVSGKAISKTLITSKIAGAEWFTGGTFGPEGSIQATLFCLIATIVLLILSHKEGKIMKPFWKERTKASYTS